LVSDRQCVLHLALATVVTYQVGVLLQGGVGITLAGGNFRQGGGNFFLIGGCLLQLAQESVHLLLFPCTPVGFRQQRRNLYFGGQVFFAFFTWTSSPGSRINSPAR